MVTVRSSRRVVVSGLVRRGVWTTADRFRAIRIGSSLIEWVDMNVTVMNDLNCLLSAGCWSAGGWLCRRKRDVISCHVWVRAQSQEGDAEQVRSLGANAERAKVMGNNGTLSADCSFTDVVVFGLVCVSDDSTASIGMLLTPDSLQISVKVSTKTVSPSAATALRRTRTACVHCVSSDWAEVIGLVVQSPRHLETGVVAQ